MKLRKNDYIELRKNGTKAIDAKILELNKDLAANKLLKMKNELKNLREARNLKRALAKLKTIKAELKESK